MREAKKDVQNSCVLFEPRKTIERETTTVAGANGTRGNAKRSEFDKLFK
jgi:hypothetical protein